jgi:hypothetical protein
MEFGYGMSYTTPAGLPGLGGSTIGRSPESESESVTVSS